MEDDEQPVTASADSQPIDVDVNSQAHGPMSQTKCVSFRSPDRSLDRYMYDEFKSKAIYSKDVPYEAIDVKLYKPRAKLVAFKTSEDRLTVWIKAIFTRYIDILRSLDDTVSSTWEEYDNLLQDGKADKIALTINQGKTKLFVLSIFVTTGRLQVQGSHYKEWSLYEFPLLLKMVNMFHKQQDDIMINDFQFNLFEDNATTTRTGVDNSSIHDDSSSDDDFSSDNDDDDDDGDVEEYDNANDNNVHENTDKSQDDNKVIYKSKNACLDTLARTSLARLESDFVDSKLAFENDITSIKQSLEEISILKDKIVGIEHSFKAQLLSFDSQYFTECNIQHQDMKEKNADLASQVKKLQTQLNLLNQNHSKLNEEIKNLKGENTNLKQELFILREISQKHENALDDNQLSQTSSLCNVNIDNEHTNPLKMQQGQTESTQAQNETNTSPVHIHPKKQQDHNPTTKAQKQPQHQSHTTKTENTILILTDSNGKFIKPDLLHTEKKVIHQLVYKISQINEVISQENIRSLKPNTVLIHCGTNDLESQSVEQVYKETTDVLKKVKSQFNESTIMFSSLLSRRDAVNAKVTQLNSKMEYFCKQHSINLISNNHISYDELFRDRKHLNRRGFILFMKNLKSALYGTQKKMREISSRSFQQQRQQQPQRTYANVISTCTPRFETSPRTGPPMQIINQQQRQQRQQQQPQRTYANVVSTYAPRFETSPRTGPPMQITNQQSGLTLHLKNLIEQLHSLVTFN